MDLVSSHWSRAAQTQGEIETPANKTIHDIARTHQEHFPARLSAHLASLYRPRSDTAPVPHARSVPHIPCSRRRIGGCRRGRVPGRSWRGRRGSGGRGRRRAWRLRILPTPRSAFPLSPLGSTRWPPPPPCFATLRRVPLPRAQARKGGANRRQG